MDGNTILAGFAVATVGSGFFMYGKKQSRPPHMIFGVITVLYPYFVSNAWLTLGIFGLLSGLLWLALRMGY